MKKTLIILCAFVTISTPAMMRALNTASTGMASQEMNVSTISNNIANVNTVGYKTQRTEFESLKYQTIREAGSSSSANTLYNTGLQIGSGSKVSGTKRDFGTGSPKITNNPFDFMISGDGFFAIILPNQEIRYSRDGAFSVNSQGTLVTKQGYPVYPNIQLPQGTISVNVTEDGKVEAFLKNQMEPSQAGQIPVFTFTNNNGLKAVGGNLYASTQSSGIAVQNIPGENQAGTVNQGTLETSNVVIMNEMTGLIQAQRAYEMNSKVMKIADEMLQTVNTLR